MSKADDLFFKEFGAVLIALTVFAVAMFFLARHIGAGATAAIQNATSEVDRRIAPVGRVRGTGDAVPAVPQMATAAAAPAAGKSAEEVYNGACVACHATGAAGAPKVGDTVAWEPRLAQGLDTLVTSAVNGKGAMPAKGGQAALSDDEIRRAVVYMLTETGLDVPGEVPAAADAAPSAPAEDQAAAPAAAMAPATVEAPPAAQPAPAPAEEAMAAAAPAAEAMAAAAPAAEAMAAVAPAAEAMAAAAPAAEAMAAAAPAAEAMAAAAPAAEANAGKPGDQIYNMACVACHATGAAGAPKLDDAAAWGTRASQGLAALVASAVNGKGAMPAKGGNLSLSDDDVHNAVAYMLKTAGVTP